MSVPRQRLDTLLVARGLAESRERAQALILAGKVAVAGQPAAKAGSLVATDADLTVALPEHPWVSRGGVKLAHALAVFGLDVRGRLAFDIGASTGGFTDVLLQHGATHVMAIDVGHHQLHWRLRTDPRVTPLEGINARHLCADDLPLPVGGPRCAGILTIDVSFISLRLVLPAVRALVCDAGDVVALVKPQFEAGRADVGAGGLVTDPAVHERVIADVTAAAEEAHFSRVALAPSPITGASGNREFLLHLRPDLTERRTKDEGRRTERRTKNEERNAHHDERRTGDD